jgi:hypothetical protein
LAQKGAFIGFFIKIRAFLGFFVQRSALISDLAQFASIFLEFG